VKKKYSTSYKDSEPFLDYPKSKMECLKKIKQLYSKNDAKNYVKYYLDNIYIWELKPIERITIRIKGEKWDFKRKKLK